MVGGPLRRSAGQGTGTGDSMDQMFEVVEGVEGDWGKWWGGLGTSPPAPLHCDGEGSLARDRGRRGRGKSVARMRNGSAACKRRRRAGRGEWTRGASGSARGGRGGTA